MFNILTFSIEDNILFERKKNKY